MKMKKRIIAIVAILLVTILTVSVFASCETNKKRADLTSTTLAVTKIDTQSAYYANVEAEKFSQAAGMDLQTMNIEEFIRVCLDNGFINFSALDIQETTDVGYFKDYIQEKIPAFSEFGTVSVSDKQTKKVTYKDKTYDYDIGGGIEDWCTLYVFEEGSEKTEENRIGIIRCFSYTADDDGYFVGNPEIAIEPVYVDGEKVINEMPFVYSIEIPLNLPYAGAESYSFSIEYTLYWQIV